MLEETEATQHIFSGQNTGFTNKAKYAAQECVATAFSIKLMQSSPKAQALYL